MNATDKTILITGGCGFIGSHLVRHLVTQYSNYKIVNLDALTYAGNPQNLQDIAAASNYQFVQANINDLQAVKNIFTRYTPSVVIHLAAETHVDRSIHTPDLFITTNVIGTQHLLECSLSLHDSGADILFFHISTDEVFGSLGDEGYFDESTSYNPRSPYAVSKAASDMLVKAYGHTHGLPYLITNCSNNYGTHQYPEKLIPLAIINILQGKPIPVYGQGTNVRDWLSVTDHVAAIDTLLHSNIRNEQFCIGGNNEWKNIDLVRKIIAITEQLLAQQGKHIHGEITYVTDRKGHDYRYAINSAKLRTITSWEPIADMEATLTTTIDWYLSHPGWWQPILDNGYKDYYQKQYHQAN